MSNTKSELQGKLWTSGHYGGSLRFILGEKKNTILVRDVGDGGVCAGMG